ncbi:PadR family transcriptional regulator [Plantibacter sp. YIM 135249]|uniref:PadR family transcriptional regulator n=1 Tax=Plantibacter sp. YIM 135249 TaxID=3423918 RepID=UPI003D3594DD
MSSIRLFILASFAEHGEMHGHQMRREAERNYVDLWTDITVGAVYGALKRLVTEGLLEEVEREHIGNRPARQTYRLSDAGREALAEARTHAMSDIWFKFDPFDLGLTRVAPDDIERLPELLQARLAALRELLEETRTVNENARSHITLTERWALDHTEHRLQSEVEWLGRLLDAAPEIVAEELAIRSGEQPRPVRGRE